MEDLLTFLADFDVFSTHPRFDEYRQPIFDHVATICAVHWDRNIRELAATTLGRMTGVDCGYMVGTVLRKMVGVVTLFRNGLGLTLFGGLQIPQCFSEDLVVRHGSLLAVGEICLAWAEVKSQEGQRVEFWTEEEYQDIIVVRDSLPMYMRRFIRWLLD